jgi:hypothetical protein
MEEVRPPAEADSNVVLGIQQPGIACPSRKHGQVPNGQDARILGLCDLCDVTDFALNIEFDEAALMVALRSRRRSRGCGSRFNCPLASPRFFFEFDILSTLRSHYTPQYCGGDLPTRLMTRG